MESKTQRNQGGHMENKTRKIQNEYTVDMVHVLQFLWHRIWIIILAGILAAGVANVYASFFETPQYSAKIQMMVKNATKAESSDIKYDLSLTASELSAAQSLVVTYKAILLGETTMQQVIDLMNERYDVPNAQKYTTKSLPKMIKVETLEETAILSITVTTDNPKNAAMIANLIAEVLPLRVVDETLDLKPLAVVDMAPTTKVNKVSPNILSSTLKGGVLGVLVAIVVLAIIAVIDSSIHDEDYVVRTYNYPILARVPRISPVTPSKTPSGAVGRSKTNEKGA